MLSLLHGYLAFKCLAPLLCSSGLNMGKVLVIGDRMSLPLFRSVGAETREASGDNDVLGHLREVQRREDVSLVVVLKHIVREEDKIISEAQKLGIPILILPTLWAPAEKINVEKLLAKALGLG